MRTPKKLAISALRRCQGLVPLSRRLPFLMILAQAEGLFEPEVAHLGKLFPAGGVAVDVGANWGMYSYALSKIASKVYAFEINPALAADLESYGQSKIQVVNAGLSSASGNMVLHVPVSNNGFAMSGWGTLHPANLPSDATEIRQIEVQVKPLDEFALSDVTFIKIDVEGHEVEVLIGASETIKRWRPHVLVEVAERNLQTVDRYFDAIQYRKVTLAELIGVAGADQNRIYIPAESRTAH
jgi:FkbM family methyltransferase